MRKEGLHPPCMVLPIAVPKHKAVPCKLDFLSTASDKTSFSNGSSVKLLYREPWAIAQILLQISEILLIKTPMEPVIYGSWQLCLGWG